MGHLDDGRHCRCTCGCLKLSRDLLCDQCVIGDHLVMTVAGCFEQRIAEDMLDPEFRAGYGAIAASRESE